MKSKVSSINSLVLVLIASSSLVSMIALTRIDNIVHGDLYRYGLSFSVDWAMPYWTMSLLAFAMGWVNIIIAIAFQFYALLYRRKEAEVIHPKEALKPETTYQPPIEERVEESKPQEITPAETAEVQTEETIASSMEVELETQREGEEAEVPVEAQRPVEEETTPQEYICPEQPEEVEGQREQEAEPRETVGTESRPEEEFEEPQEPVDEQLQEEISYAEEEQREQEEMQRESVETETQESFSPAPEIEAETQEREERQTEIDQQQEDGLTEQYPT